MGLRHKAEHTPGPEFSKKNGYKALSAGFLPAKADAEVQRDFIDRELQPRLFFVDAPHFVLGGFSGHLWSKTRVFVKTACGRRRYNVLGAINFITKKVTTVTNDSYITQVTQKGHCPPC
jgi:hypothetical protein